MHESVINWSVPKVPVPSLSHYPTCGNVGHRERIWSSRWLTETMRWLRVCFGALWECWRTWNLTVVRCTAVQSVPRVTAVRGD